MRLLLAAWLALLLVACTNLTALQGGSGPPDANGEAAPASDGAPSGGDGGPDGDASTRDGSGEPDSPTTSDSASIRGDEGLADTTVATFTVGGTVTGLAPGASVTLQDDGGAALVVAQDGSFVFSSGLETGAAFDVTVSAQPSTPVAQTCTVSGGSGTISSNVTTVSVTCVTAAFTLGGSVSGLTAGDAVVLADNGGSGLTISSNGPFVFPTPVASGAAYAVIVTTQPTSPPQTCTVQAGAGTVADADVTTVSVTCVASSFTVGGVVTGLAAGDTVTLADNGGSNLDVTANGNFAFPAPVLAGAAYDVTVFTQPTSPIAETCTVTAGSGSVGDAAVVSVVVTCSADSYMIGGTVAGLSPGGTVVLQVGASTVSVSNDGAFVFPAPFASGTIYDVTVLTQPTGAVAQTCSVNAASGTVQSADVTGVMVICATNAYTLGGTVSGLATGDSLVLLDEGSSNLMVNASGPFTFAVPLASGAGYAVTLMAQPAGPVTQACTVAQGSGTVASANINDVAVTCTTITFTVGGTVTGLANGDTVVLQDSGGAGLMVTSNGSFTFPAPVPSGSAYDVTVDAMSGTTTQTCVVGNASGTVTSANVSSVTVTCTTSSFSVGGSVSGLAGGDSVVLENNGGSSISAGSNAPFNFPTPVASGATYDVTVLTDPISPTPQICTVTNGTGTISDVNVMNVQVTCAAATLCTKAFVAPVDEPNPYGTSVTVASWSMVGAGGGAGGLGEGGAGGGSSYIAASVMGMPQPVVIGYAAGGNGGAPGSGGSAGGTGTVVLSTGPFSLAAGASLFVISGGGGGGGNDMTSGGDNTGPGGGAGYYGGGGAGNNGYGLGGSNTGGAGNMGGSMGIPGTLGVGGEGGTYAGGTLFASIGGNGVAGGTAKYGGGGGGMGSGGGGGVYGTSGGGGSNGADGSPAPSGGAGGLGANNWSSATTLPAAAGQGGAYVAGGGGGGNAGLVILTYLSPNGSCSL